MGVSSVFERRFWIMSLATCGVSDDGRPNTYSVFERVDVARMPQAAGSATAARHSCALTTRRINAHCVSSSSASRKPEMVGRGLILPTPEPTIGDSSYADRMSCVLCIVASSAIWHSLRSSTRRVVKSLMFSTSRKRSRLVVMAKALRHGQSQNPRQLRLV